MFVQLGFMLGMWIGSLLLEAVIVNLPRVNVRAHGGYLSERHGLFVMLVLGESCNTFHALNVQFHFSVCNFPSSCAFFHLELLALTETCRGPYKISDDGK